MSYAPEDEDLIYSVVGAFYEVYNTLRYGFFEQLYAAAIELELRGRGHDVAREVAVPVIYKGGVLGTQRLDMIVDDRLVVENKSTRELHPSAMRQVYSYLHATRLSVGLVLHFGPEARYYPIRRKAENP
jgi:GxxExxY protein